MQDEKKLLSAHLCITVVAAVMAIISLSVQIYSIEAHPPKLFYYYLGLWMMATAVAFAVSAALRAVFGKVKGLSGFPVSGLNAMLWFIIAAAQFGHVASVH